MKRIYILLLFLILSFHLTSCVICETCDGKKTIECKTCKGYGMEVCDSCGGGYADCSGTWCVEGFIYDKEQCDVCTYGVIINPFTWERFTCGNCKGLGYYEVKERCEICNGTGKCNKCKGSGLKKDGATCVNCSGSGVVECPTCQK